MKDPTMRARISQLHRTEAEWNKLPNFIPFPGELIVFDSDSQHKDPRIKIGDGVTLLKDLSFFTGVVKIDSFITELDKIMDAGRVTDYKK